MRTHRQELEEVIHHGSAYGGFPATATARAPGVRILAALDAAEQKTRP